MAASDMHFGAHSILFQYAKEMRAHPTPAEALLWDKLKKRALGVKFRRQHPVLFFIADFYCHNSKLIIELDGGHHRLPQNLEYDEGRSYELESLGIKVIRFSNTEVQEQLNRVVEDIRRRL